MHRNNMQVAANAQVVRVASQTQKVASRARSSNAKVQNLLKQAQDELEHQDRGLASAETALGELADEDEAVPNTAEVPGFSQASRGGSPAPPMQGPGS